MAVMNGGSTEKPNGGVSPPSVVEDEKKDNSKARLLSFEGGVGLGEEVTLSGVVNHLIESISDPNPDENSTAARPPMANRMIRIKKSLMEAAPMFREAIMNTRREVLLWTRRGSPLRALLVVSVGIATLLGLTGMLVFTLFFVAATVNAIVISLLISLAAVGGFLAIFFSCLTAIYITLLCIAAFVTFTVTISSIVAALVAAGWIGLIWMVWLAVSKSASLAKRSLAAPDVSSEQKHSQL
ncbi:uncharacterized protein LOC112515796 [Cynara cardunculus var. scolymus]|uniref:Uncharacterized protein n=1 Tax=Cynara cardunculus var. scolymus TaxID=59895 RepID=A0A103XJZ8_CYNCS|nr:uncharacterized protein LOC112515796 [Cynara cardunculus var. scolymus]KVH92151.1 hypothetical protein Ccrd_005823 [Cynara cardunculus var. scolymus]